MWTEIIESKFFTYLQRKGRERLLEKYPDITFTTSDRTPTKPKFPTVYIKKMQGGSMGDTLEDAETEAIPSSFQIEVSTNASQNEARRVAYVMSGIISEIGYRMIGDPIPDNTPDTYRNVSRYRRVIGSEDMLKF